ncbi:hypothetical protein [Necropsobacter rosorum]
MAVIRLPSEKISAVINIAFFLDQLMVSAVKIGAANVAGNIENAIK